MSEQSKPTFRQIVGNHMVRLTEVQLEDGVEYVAERCTGVDAQGVNHWRSDVNFRQEQELYRLLVEEIDLLKNAKRVLETRIAELEGAKPAEPEPDIYANEYGVKIGQRRRDKLTGNVYSVVEHPLSRLGYPFGRNFGLCAIGGTWSAKELAEDELIKEATNA